MACGGGTHQRAFAAVAVAAATEDGDESARVEFAEGAAGVFQGVRGVRVVHKNGGSAGIADVFHAARHLRGIDQRCHGVTRANSASGSCGQCGEQVIHVKAADERGAHEKGFALGAEFKFHTAGGLAKIIGANFAMHAAAIPQHWQFPLKRLRQGRATRIVHIDHSHRLFP